MYVTLPDVQVKNSQLAILWLQWKPRKLGDKNGIHAVAYKKYGFIL